MKLRRAFERVRKTFKLFLNALYTNDWAACEMYQKMNVRESEGKEEMAK